MTYVDIEDASLLAYAFDSSPNSTFWNIYVDFDENKIVDMLDAAALAVHFKEQA